MKFRAIGLPLLGLTLAACGGGGGGDGGGTGSNPPPSSSFPLTTANAQLAVSVSWQAAHGSLAVSDLAGAIDLVSSSSGGSTKPGVNATPLINRVLQKIPFGPEQQDCAVTGSLTVSGDLADPFTITAGDEINIDADNCDDGFGEVYDGSIELDVDSISGDIDSGAYALTVTLTLGNFQVATADDVKTSNGDATVTIDTTSPSIYSASVGGSTLRLDSNTESHTLRNYMTTQTVDVVSQPAPATLTSMGGLDSSELPGSVQFTTPVTFTGFAGEYPSEGELLVNGDDSSARLVALDNVNVRIDIDTNGDGTVDQAINTTWADIDD